MTRKDAHHHGNLCCSFCGKGQREVRKLIAAPTVYICDECIKLCNDIIAEVSEREEKRPAVAPASMSSKRSHHYGNLSCSFCGKGQREVRKLIAGPTVYICDECIKLCNDIVAEESAREEKRPAVALPPRQLRSSWGAMSSWLRTVLRGKGQP